jgi:hypothetical protein
MSPTILRIGSLRFYFFSREERRPHVHVQGLRGEAKFWLEPRVELVADYGLGERTAARALRLIQEHEDEISTAWNTHFGG